MAGTQVPGAWWHWSGGGQVTPTAVPQTPSAQVASRHRLTGGGQSAGDWQRQRRRPVASFAQRPEQQSAFSRQRRPGVRQATAAARSRPAMPRAAASAPANRRRLLPEAAYERATASKREPSTAVPFPRQANRLLR